MTAIFSLIALTSIWCLGILIITSEGNALYGWNKYANFQLEQGSKIWKPLLLCSWCMPSIHSLFGYAFAIALDLVDLKTLIAYPIVVAGSSIVVGVIYLFITYLGSLTEYISNVEQLSHWDIKDRSYRHQQRTQKTTSQTQHNGEKVRS